MKHGDTFISLIHLGCGRTCDGVERSYQWTIILSP